MKQQNKVGDIEIPELEGKELESHIKDNGMKLVNPENRNEWIQSDNNILNIEDMC